MTPHRRLVALTLLPLLAACGGPDIRDCSSTDISGLSSLPERLSETGLYADIQSGELAEGAIEFKPRFPLWTDGADKRRWILLPTGTQVDTSDAEDWTYPVGTATFKEFNRDGVRVETRMNLKTEGGWAAISYVWNDTQDDALLQLEPALDVSGTLHDVPGATECAACHGGRRNFTLGFSATQLEPELREELYQAGVFTDPVTGDVQLEPEARAGLGVLHGNCAHCHNSERNDQPQATDCYAPGERNAFDFTLPADLSVLREAPAVVTGAEQLGELSDSKVLNRMGLREWDDEWPPMPPLGTELVDEEGIALVEGLLEALE